VRPPYGAGRDITCEVTDASPALPHGRQAGPDDERGRGMAIVSALASASGVRAEAGGKTTWFTLALHDRINRLVSHADPEPEAGGGDPRAWAALLTDGRRPIGSASRRPPPLRNTTAE
jgi:hypothetical protein